MRKWRNQYRQRLRTFALKLKNEVARDGYGIRGGFPVWFSFIKIGGSAAHSCTDGNEEVGVGKKEGNGVQSTGVVSHS